ncbi:MAG: DUF1648 domain-containing protein [Pirellulales bacterium]|nr:DUF1648 domain-containing protein [Pirellulales bacterium]
MQSRTTAICVFCGILLVAVAHSVYYYPMLPAMMASHFDLEGQANGWASKSECMVVYAVIAGFIGVLFVGLSLAINKTPTWMLNMPHKDYWLAPERQEESYRWLSVSMMWIGNATMAMLVVCMEIVFRANLWPAWKPGTAFLVTLCCYMTVVLVWTGLVLYRFRLPKETLK